MSSNDLTTQSGYTRVGNTPYPAMSYLSALSKEGQRTIGSRLKAVAEKFGFSDPVRAPWHHLDYTHVRLVLSWLRGRGLAPNTINHYLAALRGVARECFRLGIMDVENYQRIRLVGRATGSRLRRSRRLRDTEIDRLLACVKKIRDEALLLVALQGGLRRSELVALNWSDWDRASGLLTVRGKGDKERAVRISGRAESALGALWDQAKRDDAVFLNANNGRLSSQSVYWITQELCEASGVEPFSPHSYRHTMITEMLEKGVDPFTVQRVAGHAQTETTMGYDQRPIDAVAAAGKVVER